MKTKILLTLCILAGALATPDRPPYPRPPPPKRPPYPPPAPAYPPPAPAYPPPAPAYPAPAPSHEKGMPSDFKYALFILCCFTDGLPYH
ncbi:hypothetical protein SK128_021795 [Halocaridina rubra]|uniref:Uncharacterized protein n=1 Tax=Halocaridina rubra TaxID=373956 RepID=A0AAN8WSC8_HALRR